jgi:DNA anti-recombination protein RmuC
MEKDEKVIEVLKTEMSKMEKKIKHEIAKSVDRSYVLSHQLDKLTGNEKSMNF